MLFERNGAFEDRNCSTVGAISTASCLPNRDDQFEISTAENHAERDPTRLGEHPATQHIDCGLRGDMGPHRVTAAGAADSVGVPFRLKNYWIGAVGADGGGPLRQLRLDEPHRD